MSSLEKGALFEAPGSHSEFTARHKKDSARLNQIPRVVTDFKSARRQRIHMVTQRGEPVFFSKEFAECIEWLLHNGQDEICIETAEASIFMRMFPTYRRKFREKEKPNG